MAIPVDWIEGIFLFVLNLSQMSCFWDTGTTTVRGRREDDTPRVSFFRWQWVYSLNLKFWFYWWDWDEIARRRRLNTVAGISIDLTPLSTATILNRRVLLTSYNYLDPYINRQLEMRIWALGRGGEHNTPYRYRVYNVHRLLPLSGNPEHCHGPRCSHQPRHDVSIVICRDMMYIYDTPPNRYHFAYRAFMVPTKYYKLDTDIWMSGSGYEYMEHIEENYKIFYHLLDKKDIIDCSKVLPKWWGKFICMINTKGFPGVQNGGGFYSSDFIIALGCFEIRYNELRVFAFTDLRYYYTKIYHYAHLSPGQYYEYAYPQWGVYMGWIYEGHGNYPYVPFWQMQYDFHPLG